MKIRSLFFVSHARLTTAALLLAAAGAFAPGLRAQQTTLTTWHSFTRTGTDGAFPYAGLTVGSDGNLYGTTTQGGTNDTGTVFTMTPGGAVTTLHSFLPVGNNEGLLPYGELVEGTNGTTYTGTSSDYSTIFTITSGGSLTTVYQFNSLNANPLAYPFAGLTQAGPNLFLGTTSGGNTGPGAIYSFTLSGPAAGVTLLHAFDPSKGEGSRPYAGMTVGPDGNFYGTTLAGGEYGYGTVFKLSTNGVFTVLHSFTGTGDDGGLPYGKLVTSGDGYLYGTTLGDGNSLGNGTVYKITGTGVFTTLHHFTGTGGDGAMPYAGLIIGKDQNLYGTTSHGGERNNNNGTVFVMTRAGTVATLHSFTGGADGGGPRSPLVQAADGSFYGTTVNGGADNDGTIFHVTGIVPDPFFISATALSNGVYYLSFPNGNYFGYFAYLTDPRFIYHFDLGYEYTFDAADGRDGEYFFDFKSSGFFYTSPTFPFPYLYDFSLSTVLYYYADPNSTGHYNTDGVRYFYDFATGEIISK